jgi:hypothetical protein
MGAVLEKPQCSPCQLPEFVKPRIQQIPSLPLIALSDANNGHSQQVNTICIFAANTRALTASSDGTLKVNLSDVCFLPSQYYVLKLYLNLYLIM